MTTMGVKTFASLIKRTIENDNDCVVTISGSRGIGKSVLMGVTTNLLVPSYYTESGFRQYNIYDRNEFEDKLKNSPPESVLCLDEGITSLYKRDFSLKQQGRLIKLLNMYRDRRYIIFLVLPLFWDLDYSIRSSLIVKFWVHVYKRGEGYIFIHEDNPFTPDVWLQRYNYELFKTKAIYTSPNYLSNITFPNMPPEAYNLYKQIKNEKRAKADMLEARGHTDMSKKEMVEAALRINPSLKVAQLAQVLDTTDSYIYELIREREANGKS